MFVWRGRSNFSKCHWHVMHDLVSLRVRRVEPSAEWGWDLGANDIVLQVIQYSYLRKENLNSQTRGLVAGLASVVNRTWDQIYVLDDSINPVLVVVYVWVAKYSYCLEIARQVADQWPLINLTDRAIWAEISVWFECYFTTLKHVFTKLDCILRQKCCVARNTLSKCIAWNNLKAILSNQLASTDRLALTY